MKRVLVIGDTILDEYVYGSVERISPEAPIPVFDAESRLKVLGGACNVAANIRTLFEGDLEIDYLGFNSQQTTNLLKEYSIECVGIPVSAKDILTKTRYVSENQQLFRSDKNKKYKAEAKSLIPQILERKLAAKDYDLLVVSDYDKDTLTEVEFEMLQDIRIPKIIDLKRVRPEMGGLFQEADAIIKCNMPEYDANPHIVMLGARVVVTNGGKGYFFPQTGERFSSIKGKTVNAIGAGDVFLAGMAVNYLEEGEFDIKKLAVFGNVCAGAKVKHFGTVAIKRDKV